MYRKNVFYTYGTGFCDAFLLLYKNADRNSSCCNFVPQCSYLFKNGLITVRGC